MLDEQRTFETDFSTFIELLWWLFCRRCVDRTPVNKDQDRWAIRIPDVAITHGRCFGWHHHGSIYQLLQDVSFTDEQVNAWERDIEHGVFHGIMVAYWATRSIRGVVLERTMKQSGDLFVPDKPHDFETLVLGCLLHDVVRCAGPDVDHDSKLRKHAPNLLDDVYSHSKPESTTKLVQADRIELMRYPDWKSWVTTDVLATTGCSSQASIFYNSIRPALAKLWSNRHSVWVRHGAEVDLVEPFDKWPQGYEGSMVAVDTGKLAQFSTMRNPVPGCLFDNSIGFFPRGLVPAEVVRNAGFSFRPYTLRVRPNRPIQGRDHLALSPDFSLPIHDWVFLHRWHHWRENQKPWMDAFLTSTHGVSERVALSFLTVAEKIVQAVRLLCT